MKRNDRLLEQNPFVCQDVTIQHQLCYLLLTFSIVRMRLKIACVLLSVPDCSIQFGLFILLFALRLI